MNATATPADEAKDTRRINRMPLNLPVKVEGLESPDSGWEEITRLRDVSNYGAGFTLSRPIKWGRLIKLTLPMPRQLRVYDFYESQYQVWAVVRRCLPLKGNDFETYFLGVAFIGKVPPKSFTENPDQVYDLTNRSEEGEGLWEITPSSGGFVEGRPPTEDRRHSRYEIPIDLRIDVLDSEGGMVESESTVTENISLGGASVFTTLTVEKGARVRILCRQFKTEITAIVRDRRVGNDGVPRLHIEFIDKLFPLSGIIP